jgi:hypothetical protein
LWWRRRGLWSLSSEASVYTSECVNTLPSFGSLALR